MNLPWYLQPAFMPVHPQDLVLWVNSSSWDGTTWRNLAPSYSNVNHSTLMNGVAFGNLIHPSGIFGAPRKFDGINDYVNCGSDSSLDTTDAITIEVWVKTTAAATQRMVGKSGDSGDSWVGWSFLVNSDGTLFSRCHITDNRDVQSNETVNDGNWHHIVAKAEAGQLRKIYIDGNEATYSTQETAESGTYTNSQTLKIGRHTYSAIQYFNGSIDEVKIYNRALSASEVVHNHTHSPIYYMQHGIDPLSLLSQTPQEVARVVA